jgi:LysM repeat protein
VPPVTPQKLSVALDRHLFHEHDVGTQDRSLGHTGRLLPQEVSDEHHRSNPRLRYDAHRAGRRGRLVLLIGFVAVVFALLSVFGGQSAATSEVGEPVPTRTVQVSQGDTLWNIAATVAEPGQVRAMIHQIQELNALSGAGLEVGQQIAVPLS